MSRAPFLVIDGRLYRWKVILELRRAQLAAAGAAEASQLALFGTLHRPSSARRPGAICNRACSKIRSLKQGRARSTASNSRLDAQQHCGQTGRMTPEDYEKAVLQRFRTLCPPPRFVVKHNIRLSGHKTKTPRQVDVGIFETGKSQPFLIGEAKRHKRPIDAGIAGLRPIALS
jgi:hypothetical protein